MAWTTPSTAAGGVLTSAIWNASARDNLLHLRGDTQAQTGATTLVDGSAPIVLVNFSAGVAATINLPAAPSTGQRFLFMDTGVTWATKPLTIGRNGKNIDYASANVVIADTGASYELVYNGTTWITTFSSVTGWARTGTDDMGLARGSFRAYLNSAQSVIASTVSTVLFDGEDFDISAWHDVTVNKGRFTPQLPGIYRLSAFVQYATAFGDQKQLNLNLVKNGSFEATVASIYTSGTPTDPGLGGSVLVKMNGSTDWVSMSVFQADTAARSLATGRLSTYWCGEMVGKTS